MAENLSAWNVLLVAPNAVHSPTNSNNDRRNFREGHVAGIRAMYSIAVGCFEGLLKSMLDISLPKEEMTFTRVCGAINNQVELDSHKGRICMVRRVNEDLLRELMEMTKGKENDAQVSILAWDEGEKTLFTSLSRSASPSLKRRRRS